MSARMHWLFVSIGALLLWGGYPIFADKATQVHGEKISFFFEMAGMVLITFLVFVLWGGFEDIKKVTPNSLTNAIVMGLMTSSAAFLTLLALRLAPSSHHVPIIILITGFYPVVTVLLSYFFLGVRLTNFQWLGVVLAMFALFFINWGK